MAKATTLAAALLGTHVSDYTPLYRWRFDLAMKYTGSIYQAL
jgi:hypothetical protein